MTPGQAAYEARARYITKQARVGSGDIESWFELPERLQPEYEAMAQAAIDWWHADRDLEPPRDVSSQEPSAADAGQLLDWAATLIACAVPGPQMVPASWHVGALNWRDCYHAFTGRPRRAHVHDPWRCPAHVEGCECLDLASSACNPYHVSGHCPDDPEFAAGPDADRALADGDRNSEAEEER